MVSMKKNTVLRAAMLLLAMFCGLSGARAVTVTVGDLDESSDDPYLPLNSTYVYSYSQQIYTAEEIGTAGTINAVTFWLTGYANIHPVTVDIYMKEVDKASFDEGGWVTLSATDKVYSGTLTFSNTTVEAKTFTLSTPFIYNGNGNLLIAVNKSGGSDVMVGGVQGKVFSSGSSFKSVFAIDNSTAINPASPPSRPGTRYLKRNVVQLDITPAVPDDVLIGDKPENCTNFGTLPVNSAQKYSYSQQIYNADEIGRAGTINSITLWLTGKANLPQRSIDIYMKEVDKTSFTKKTDWVPLSDNDLVYTGTLTVQNTEVQAYTIQLDKPFYYTGTHGLLIAFNDKTGSATNGLGGKGFIPSTLYMSICGYSSAQPIDPAAPSVTESYTNTAKNNIMFNFEPASSAIDVQFTIGDPSKTYYSQYDYLPVAYNGQYSYCQQIFTAEEMQTAGTIRAITLWLQGFSTSGTPVDIYMKEVDKDEFSYGNASIVSTQWVPMGEDDLVYSGKVTLNTSNPEYAFKLDKPFQYSGKHNLLIAFNKTDKNASNINGNEFDDGTYTTRAIYTYRSGYGKFDPTMPIEGDYQYPSSKRNVIGFDIIPVTETAIGSGNQTASQLPTTNVYNYSLTQQIYTAAELGQAATIKGIDFYCDSQCTRQLDIYMVSTDKSSFSDANDWCSVTEYDLVFSGEVHFAQNAWTTITLDNTFEYDGQHNVLLVVDDNTGSWYSYVYFRSYKSEQYQTLYDYNDYTNYDPTNPSSSGSTLQTKNQIRLHTGMAADVQKPKVTVGDVKATSATLSWTGEGDSYDMRFGIIPAEAWLQYDNGARSKSFDSGTYTTTWGVMYPGSQVTGRKLTKVAIYEGTSNTSDITLSIYSNGTHAPGTLLYTQTVTPEHLNSFHEIVLATPVAIIPGENLWITLTEAGANVVPCCQVDGADPNGKWICLNGMWRVDDNSSRAGCCWMIRGCMEEITAEGGIWEVSASTTEQSYPLTGLEPETSYVAQVRAKDSELGNSSWATVNFTTPELLAKPINVEVADITRTTATLSWTGYHDSYEIEVTPYVHPDKSVFTQAGSDVITTDELLPYTFDLTSFPTRNGIIAIRHYKASGPIRLYIDDIKLKDKAGNEVLTEGFENGSLPDWIYIAASGDKSWWSVYCDAIKSRPTRAGSQSSSYIGDYCAASVISSYQDDDWFIIPGVMLGGTLTLYAKSDTRNLKVSNDARRAVFGVYATTSADPLTTPVTTTLTCDGSPYTVTGLEPGVYHWFNVRGVRSANEKTDWSNPLFFMTKNYILGDVNDSGDVTPADAIMILYRYFGVDQSGFIEEAADLNHDGSISPADAIEALYLYFGAGSGSSPKARSATVAVDPE